MPLDSLFGRLEEFGHHIALFLGWAEHLLTRMLRAASVESLTLILSLTATAAAVMVHHVDNGSATHSNDNNNHNTHSIRIQ